IRLLVEELYSSNAGLAGPKLVEWDHPSVLQCVGIGIDKLGERAPISEPGELDQEQHDAVRDVFCLPTACLLVRTDLFRALGGFDPAVHEGDDLDLCWRVHVSGARVLVVPAARARHLGRLDDRVDREKVEAWTERQRLQTVLTCYRPFSLLRVLPQLAVASVIGALASLVTGRPRRAGALMGAWFASLGRVGEINRRRRALAGVRQVPDSEVRNLQVRGFARLKAFFRGHGAREERVEAVSGVGRNVLESVRGGPGRGVVLVWLVAVAAFLLGCRSLITDGVPAVGGLLPFPDSAADLWRLYASSWWPGGVGGEQAAPTGIALTGVLGTLTLGAMGMARTLAIVGPVLAGYAGAWRLARPFERPRAAVGALIVYAAVPLPYNALAEGRWSGVIVYGAMPWILLRLARLSDLEPYGPAVSTTMGEAGAQSDGGARGRGWDRLWLRECLVLGLVLAVPAAFVPLLVPVSLLIAVALLLGSLVVGGISGGLRALAGAVVAAAVAALLHLPWSVGVLGDGWQAVAGVPLAAPEGRGLDALARFATGPFGAGYLVYGIWVAAALALVISEGWRLAWTVRALSVVAGFGALAVVADRGLVPFALGPVEVLLAPVAVGLAMAVACGAAAAELDVQGKRLGWRQPATLVATVLVVASALPALAATADGRWEIGRTDLSTPLSFLPTQRTPGAYRILWTGDPRALPAPGWRLVDGVAYGLSDDGAPTLLQHWTDAPGRGEQALAEALLQATSGATDRLGHLLAPVGVRYVIVPSKARPALNDGGEEHPPPPSLVDALASQLDLRSVDVDDALAVFENTAWIPARAALSPQAVAASQASGSGALATADLGTSTGVLLEVPDPSRFTGPVTAGDVYFAAEGAGRWRLTVDGQTAEARVAFGWARAYEAGASGAAELRHDNAPTRLLMVLVQLALWVGAVGVLARAARAPARQRRRDDRRARAAAAEVAALPAPVLIELDQPHADDLPWVRGDEPDDLLDDALGLRWAEDVVTGVDVVDGEASEAVEEATGTGRATPADPEDPT
ncbi:MAG TPA: hypothetical protein VF855_13370, partial [Acidimicrobiales bacterium]